MLSHNLTGTDRKIYWIFGWLIRKCLFSLEGARQLSICSSELLKLLENVDEFWL